MPADEEQAAAHDPTGLDLARAVTRSLRSAARAGANRPRTSARLRRTGSVELSGAHPDGRDPAPVADAVQKLVSQSGWERELAVHGVFSRWADVVGEEVAAHSRPEHFADGRLTVRTDSTAWATELRLQAKVVLRRLNEELGDGSVNFIDFAGPEAPSWVKGRRTMPGRGPRDTYG